MMKKILFVAAAVPLIFVQACFIVAMRGALFNHRAA
jgi:hypothetical protein